MKSTRRFLSKIRSRASQFFHRSSLQDDPLAPIERLPPELRLEILISLDYSSFRALIHASPTYFQQYIYDSSHILCQCLARQLGPANLDAFAAYRSGKPDFLEKRDREEVRGFIGEYSKLRSDPNDFDIAKWVNAREARDMLLFHERVVRPLVERYADWALANLAAEVRVENSVQGPQQKRRRPLSAAEQMRITRALYRAQLYSNLFGHGAAWTRLQYGPQLHVLYSSVEVVMECFAQFEPWEVEELVCVFEFGKEKYAHVFEEIKNVIEPNDEDGVPAIPLEDGWERQDLLGGTVFSGLQPLLAILSQESPTPESLIPIVKPNLRLGGYLFESALLRQSQTNRRTSRLPSPLLSHASARDLKQKNREAHPFKGDTVGGLYPSQAAAHPPFAWTVMWKGTWCNLWGKYINGDLRKWGYVMWDRTRMEEEGGMDVLSRQWDDGRDVREEIEGL